MNKQYSTAILLVTFNRPEETKQVLESISKLAPPRLYFASDGPRTDRPDDYAKVTETRKMAEQIAWPCSVYTLFREENLGCGKSVSSAIDWFFEHEEEGIILEDDCLANMSFFYFCQELLQKYRDDQRVMVVSGNNFQFGKKRNDASYYFSKYSHCWGWASWRRAWKHFDSEMLLWPKFRDRGYLQDILIDKTAIRVWEKNLDQAYASERFSWAYRWTLSCWAQGGMTILPNENLVSNVGFGEDATHTTDVTKFANMPVAELTFPLIHPEFVLVDRVLDEHTQKTVFQRTFLTKLIRFVRRILKNH